MQNFAQYPYAALFSCVLTDSITNSRAMSRQIVRNTKYKLLLRSNIVYFISCKKLGGGDMALRKIESLKRGRSANQFL